MLIAGFPSAVFGTNCYVVAAGAGEECLVVDPGIAVLDDLAQVLREHRLRPAAVLLTHGHLDHTYSVTPVCGGHGVAAYVHPDDRERLVDPLAEFASTGMLAMLEQQFGSAATWREPDDVVEVGDGASLEVAGLQLDVVHAPGHTEGSVMFALPQVPSGAPDEVSRTLLTGDVLFAGSIGRTDLPGGDHAAMLRSLRDRVLTQPDDSLVLPGHGPATTIGRERASNPFLRELLAS
ncbi:MAG TPA: MBL fold metallo-hydrolase [Angustibacter sp.]|nr:MBL fold metallo-hydrolase [Angustibacter sp.]